MGSKDKGKADYAQKDGGNGGDTMDRQGMVNAANSRSRTAATSGGRLKARRGLRGSKVIGGETTRVIARLDSDRSRPGLFTLSIFDRDHHVPAAREGDVP